MINNFQRFGNKCYGYTERERIIIVRDSVLLSLWIITIRDTVMVEGKAKTIGVGILCWLGKWNIILQ